MHVALLLVGAHTGEKQRETILQATATGAVILIEPVPFLFTRLSQTYAGIPNITCLNCCIAPVPGKVNFFAPTEEAVKTVPWAGELGSMSADHAALHHHALAPHIIKIQVEGVTFSQLVNELKISSLDLLFTDTEGHDAGLLSSFPFELLMPDRIIFEHKHADGTFNIGRNLGRLLITLDERGYDMQIIDLENCQATRRPVSA